MKKNSDGRPVRGYPYLLKLVLIMKLTFALILIGCLQVSAGVYSQTRVSLKLDGTEMKKVLSLIEEKTVYRFLYNQSLVEDRLKVTLQVKDEEVVAVLDKLLHNTSLKYEVLDDYLIVLKGDFDADKDITVNGKITGADGEPLVGASVNVKNSALGTATNANGNFSLTVPDNAVLVISYIGYETVEVAVKGRSDFNISLKPSEKVFDQVVVVGYGRQRKVNLTGAVASASGEDLANRPVTSTSVGLQGLLPGVTITNFSAMPGQTTGNIRIRGIGTLNNSNPLVLVDGIEQNMNLVNPDDIESVSVLKDAASAAIYGSRGANGVILITTKKGKDGKAAVSYSFYYGIQKPTAQTKFLGSPEYMELLNESQKNVGRAPTYNEEEIQKARTGSDPNYFANTNWVDEIFKKQAPVQNHNLSINGGAGKSRYYFSYGYLDQSGLITGDAYYGKRHNARLKLNTELVDRVQVETNLGYTDRDYGESSWDATEAGGPIYSAHQISPLVPLRFTNGQWGYGGGSTNPVAMATDGGTNQFGSQEFSGNVSGTLDILKGWTAKAQYGLVMSNSKRTILSKTVKYYNPDTGAEWWVNNALNKIDSRDYTNRYQNLTLHTNVEQKFNGHTVQLMAGYSQEWNRGEYFQGTRQVLVTEDLPVLDVGTQNQLNRGDASHWAIRSLFSRLNYDFDNKYLFEANIRYDGSSRFEKSRRWGAFPSVSAGWRITEESFMEGLKGTLSEAKLRASWGMLGNQYVNSSLYPYLSTLEPVSTMPIGDVLTSAFAQGRAANPNLTWESVTMTNAGLDLGFFNNRLSVTADYFVKKTNDILLRVPLPDVLGVSEPDQNAGAVENRGWELSARWSDNVGKVKYSVRANLSDVQNKVTSLGNVPPTIGDQVRIVGYPIDAFYGLVADRIAQAEDFDYNAATNKYTPLFPVITGDARNLRPGDIIYKDLDKDGEITTDKDRAVIGSPFPRYSYSFLGDISWQGLDLSFFLQGVGKGNGYIKGAGRHAYITESANPQAIHLDRWTPENTHASYPRLTYQQSHNQRFSSFWLENAAYLRLKNVQLGYSIPAGIASKARIQKLRFYVSGENLFTKTNFFYAFDPETPVSSGGYYPQIKTLLFGLNVTLK